MSKNSFAVLLILYRTCWLDLQVRYKVYKYQKISKTTKSELLTRAESSMGQCVRKIETLPVMLKFTRKLIFILKPSGVNVRN